jgi:hypothetical protein
MKKLLFASALTMLAAATVMAAQKDSEQSKSRLRLVVQQNGQALVCEQRSLVLPKGQGQIRLDALPATLDVHSLQLRSKSDPGELDIQAIAIDEELLTPAALLKRHVGGKVTLIMPDGKTRDGRVQKEAVLLSAVDAPVFLIDGKVYAGPYDAILYPETPDGLAPEPRLGVTLNNRGPARQTIELTYLAREITWRMDYVLGVNKSGTSALVSGWASITNHSGAAYPGAQVELLAGEPRRVNQFAPRALFAGDAMVKAMAAAPESAAPEELFEYQLYRLPQPLDLGSQQTRQVPLFRPATIPVTRKLLGRAQALPSGREAEPVKERLDAYLSLKNTSELGLGLPLPAGTLKAYQDDDGKKHFIGEAPLERTPVGETAELRIGQAFDLSVERVVKSYEKTGKDSRRATWELRIRNAKKTPQRLTLHEQIPGEWRVVEASRRWARTQAGVLEFTLDVPPTGSGDPYVLTYTFATEL